MMDRETLAREILKAIDCLEGVKKLHYSFTGEKYSLSDIQAVINSHTEQLAQLVLKENPARGEKISPENFNLLAEKYEKVMLRDAETISKLKMEVNNLRQKLEKVRAS